MKLFSLLITVIISFSILSGQKGIYDQTMLEHKWTKPVMYNIFENGEELKGRYLQHVSEGITLNIKDNALKQILTESPQTITLQLPAPLNISLDLYQTEVFSHDFKLNTSDGKKYDFCNEALFYRGTINRDKNSIAAVTLTKDEIHIMYSNRSVNKRIQKTEDNKYIAFEDKNIRNQKEFICGVKDDNVHDEEILYETTPINLRYSTEECATVFVVCDYESYLDNNSDLRKTYLWVAKIWNEVITLYENEEITVRVPNMLVYTSATSDPTRGLNDIYSILAKFELLFGPSSNGLGWFKHFMSTRHFNSTVGVAGLGYVNCANYFNAVSISLDTDIAYFPNYSQTVTTIAHEMGHNLGSNHTHWCGWIGGPIDNCAASEGICSPGPTPTNGGTIMSYCDSQPSVGINFSLGFGDLPGNKIRSTFNSLKTNCNLGNCLTDGTRCTDAADLPCGSFLQGTNILGSWDNAPICGPLISGPGVWYKFTGNGQNTVISTCMGNNFNTIINVYRGSCNNLFCVAGNDDYCYQGSQVSFSALNGVNYFVLVQGTGVGNFTINRTCINGPNTNDICSAAMDLPCGQTITGNTLWAQWDLTAPACGSNISAAGVWYKFTGNGQNTIISTCPQSNIYFSRLNVYRNDCNNLSCVTNNDGFCFPGSEVSFSTLNGVEYFVLVHGFNNEKGDFNIKRTCINIPPGDKCSSALSLNCGSSVAGTTIGTSLDPEISLCGYTPASVTPGIWYTFTGNGQNSSISTCNQNTLDTKLNIFTGSCSGLLTCIAENDNFCGWGSQITIPTISGDTYYVLVSGYYETGNFTITRSCSNPLTGDVCSTAISLPCNSSLTGSTSSAALDVGLPYCGGISAPGVWYKIIGNGDISKVSTCTQNNFDTELFLYSGQCENLNCLSFNNNFCGEGSQISFETEQDSIYYILVSGNGEQGNFSISHDCIVPIEGDECSTAIDILCDEIIYGNTALASIDPNVCGNNTSNFPGMWYRFIGNGKINEIFLNSFASNNSKISVLYGNCNDLNCLQSSSTPVGFPYTSFFAESGVQYYILISGDFYQGSFEIYRTCRISSDICNSALQLLCGDTLTGSTINANMDFNLPSCGGFSIQSPSVWYKIIGNGQVNEISTCGEFSFDTRISVYRNQETYLNSCDAVQICIAGNDNSCDQGSKVSFPTLYGAAYYILVHGVGGASGSFEISRNCVTALGDNCNIALDLPCDGSLTGTTIGALYDYNLPNCGINIHEPGIWYTFTGNNQNNIISTCTAASFDTRIHIYKGSCTNLICVTANDNYCDNRSSVTFFGQTGIQYYVFVSGANFGFPTPGGGQGSFTITRSCYVPAINDECQNAITISCGQTLNGSLLNAGPETVGSSCESGALITRSGVWYKFVGDGQNTNFSFTGTTFTRLFRGSCNELICLDGSWSNSRSFTTELNTTYYLYFLKNTSTTDNFTLTRTCSNQVSNDLCSSAINLPCGVEISGTTIGAAGDSEIESLSPFSFYPLCQKSIYQPGVWYKFIGNGQNMEIHTCTTNSFFTNITVFQNECNQLTCIGDDVIYNFCGNGSKINITTVAGYEYFILVHGFNSTTGNFTIRRNCTTPSAGDNCQNAINLTCGQTLSGTTVGKPSDNPEIPTCLGNECCYKLQGVWYKFTGNGQVAKISTCTNSPIHTTLHLYKYDCSNLECVEWDSYCNENPYGADIEFLSVVNQQYYIYVERVEAPGAFNISYTCTTPVSGTSCSTAVTLACGQSITSDSYDSWFPDNVPFCGNEVNSRSNWFKFTGTGENTVISTCSSQNTTSNTIISIFEGTCTNLNCITSNDDFCGVRSNVSFTPLNGVEYYILVHGDNEFGPGDFTITRACDNDICTGAIDIPCGTSIEGSTINALSSSGLTFCGTSISAPGVWFRFSGNGQNTELSTCGYYSYDTKINVYYGACSGLVCLEGNDNFCGWASQVSFPTQSGIDYFVFVQGAYNDVGNFTLTRSCDSNTQYCQSSGLSPYYHSISEVQIDTFINPSDVSSYSKFDQDTLVLSKGGMYYLRISTLFAIDSSPVYYKVWADFNHDGDFEDETEELYSLSPGNTMVSDSITIPWSALSGPTRLRISSKLESEPLSCELFNFGEVEDYIININNELPAFEIMVNETSGTSNNDGNICKGESTTLIASGGIHYLWSTGATTSSITVSPISTISYTVTVTHPNGFPAISTRSITVNELPIPGIILMETSGIANNDGEICAGATATLTASGGGTYVWSTGATTSGITVNPPITTTYTVTATDVNNCTATANTTITVNPLPSVTIFYEETSGVENDGTICPGAQASIIAIGGSTYLWSNGAITNFITVTPLVTTNYIVFVTNNEGCTSMVSITISVVPDTEPPQITCPPHVTINCGESILPLNTGTPITSDNCDIDLNVFFNDIPSGTNCPDGDLIVRMWTVVDISGNNAICEQEIHILSNAISCGDSFYDSGGLNASYSNNVDITKTICPENVNEVVQLAFTAFDVQTNYDALYTYNGDDISAPQISSNNPATLSGFPAGGFYGAASPGPFTADNNSGCLTFRFRSDNDITASGWTAEVSCLNRPINDNCADAILVSCNSTTSGSTRFSRPESPPACGTSPGARGVWYKINVGNQAKNVTINTCSTQTNFDTKINVYVGGCGNFSCITGNDDFCGFRSQVQFSAYNDTDYYIFISGFIDATGDFSMSISCTNIWDFTCGETFYDSGGVGSNYLNNEDRIWTVCPESISNITKVEFSSFDIELLWDALYVYNGPNIYSPQISSGNPQTLSGFPAGGFYGTNIPAPFIADNDSGCLTFRFRSDFSDTRPGWASNVNCLSRPLNDNCADAILVSCNSMVSGSTIFARSETALSCGTTPGIRGVWYKINVGAQPKYAIINTCSSQTNFDTKINIYVGQCEGLNCIVGNDDSCGGQSQVQFEADNDTDYYIFISGFGNTTGDFTLTISCFDQQLGCSEQFYDSGGATSGYQNGEDKVTLICPQIPGDKINVLFNSFDLSNAFLNNDFLQVFDGKSIFNSPLHTGMGFSGINLPTPLTAQNETGCLTFRFLSDYADIGSGWDADINCITCSNSVSTSEDDIFGSLRWAIYCAAPNSTIQFSPALNNSILNVTNSPLILNKNLNFHQTLSTSLSLRSINADRILDISPGKTVSLKYISLYSQSGSTGRAIRNQGNLTLEHVNIFDQQVPGSAILNTGSLNILGNVNLIKED